MRKGKQKKYISVFLAIILIVEAAGIVWLLYKWKSGDILFREEKLRKEENMKIEETWAGDVLFFENVSVILTNRPGACFRPFVLPAV